MYREEVEYKVDYKAIKECREHVREISIKHGFYDVFLENIEISIGELFTNIIKHGRKKESDQDVENTVKVEISFDENIFEINFLYKGNIPTEERIKEVNEVKEILEIEELSESGRGIFIMNQLMDKLSFEKQGEKAKATLIKFL